MNFQIFCNLAQTLSSYYLSFYLILFTSLISNTYSYPFRAIIET